MNLAPNNRPVGISFIIPTRNRGDLLFRAIQSLPCDTHSNIEVVVVDDGSDEPIAKQIDAFIERNTNKQVRCVHLPQRPQGHGPSFARNTGVSAAKYSHIGFLDDDDIQICTHYIDKLCTLLQQNTQVQVVLANQEAVDANGLLATQNIWLEKYLQTERLPHSNSGFSALTSDFFDDKIEFAHVNTLLLSHALFERCGGFNENLRYEEDREFFYRILALAPVIMAYPKNVARHYIPQNRPSASHVQIIDKLLIQSHIYTSAMLAEHSANKKALLKLQLQFCFKHMATHLCEQHDNANAHVFAKQALALGYSFKWHLYIGYLSILKRFK